MRIASFNVENLFERAKAFNLQDKDAARANRVMQAMLKMVKLDIAELKRAYEGG